jgi:two-component system phosphate regulon sensor histidine kinase PhoR
MKANRRIVIILLAVVFLPALFFSVYEIGSLNQNEVIIDDIYNKQLEVILSSVNSHSQDWASSWAMKMNGYFAYPQTDLGASLLQFVEDNPSVKGVFYTRDTSYQNLEIISLPEASSISSSVHHRTIEMVLRQNSKKINKLYLYLKGGYRKIEAFSSDRTPDISYFVFVADSYRGHKILCGMIVDAKEFVNFVLSPKIQALVENQFIITVQNDTKGQIIYASETSDLKRISQTKPLWLLPDYKMGIIYKSKTIKELVKERTTLNFIIIFLLDTLLVAGVWLVLRNFKAEIKLSQMRVDFISNVSHELRTPLALMSLHIETILLGRVKGEKLNEYYKVIHQETNRLTTIVNKILNFSKLEEKKFEYHFQKMCINEVIQEVLEQYYFYLQNTNFETEINLSAEKALIYGDKEALKEVFINLIDNATKYSKDQKYLHIETEIEKDLIKVTIQDKGIGIPESDQKYIFDKFFRVTNGEMQGVRGSGLGLSIVKNILDNHDAVIYLNSKPGQGTTFNLEFPGYAIQLLKKRKIRKHA